MKSFQNPPPPEPLSYLFHNPTQSWGLENESSKSLRAKQSWTPVTYFQTSTCIHSKLCMHLSVYVPCVSRSLSNVKNCSAAFKVNTKYSKLNFKGERCAKFGGKRCKMCPKRAAGPLHQECFSHQDSSSKQVLLLSSPPWLTPPHFLNYVGVIWFNFHVLQLQPIRFIQ